MPGVARGERPVGYKIGFTNRTIWPLYGINHPIWAPVYDTTVELLNGTRCEVTAARFVEARLEPEIVFGLRSVPASSEPADLVTAIDWYAHGYEIVQSVYPGWKQTAAEAFAAQGMHGALKVGPRHPLSLLRDPATQLAALQIQLLLNGDPKAQGVGANVLGGPIQALSHLVRELANRGQALRPGDIITTGTLTDAMPAGYRSAMEYPLRTPGRPRHRAGRT